MDAPNRVDSTSRTPFRSSERRRSIRFEHIQLNDRPPTPINAAREVNDSIKPKTLVPLYESWVTLKLVEKKIRDLAKKSPEFPSLKQHLDKTKTEINRFDLNDLNTEHLVLDLKELKLTSDEAEDFCLFLVDRMKEDTELRLIAHIFESEVKGASQYTTINRVSTDEAQVFVTAFQKAHLDKCFKWHGKFSDKHEKEALEVIKKFVRGVKDHKNEALKDFYSSLYESVEKKFPEKGEELVLSLIFLRYLGPTLTSPVIVEGQKTIPDNNVAVTKIIQSFISRASPPNMNLSPEFMAEGYAVMRKILPYVIYSGSIKREGASSPF